MEGRLTAQIANCSSAGKALAIFGDTGPCDAALDTAKGVDVMVHEATLDITMEAKANSRGHSSTPVRHLTREAGVRAA